MGIKRLVLLLLLVGCGVIAFGGQASADPADPRPFTLRQPDGAAFRARVYGDEWNNGVETATGYTVVQGRHGVWRYARANGADELEPTRRRAEARAPRIQRHLRPHSDGDGPLRESGSRSAASQDAVAGISATGGGGSGPVQHSGTEPLLVLLVEFDDVPHTAEGSPDASVAAWRDSYFGAASSAADYYDEVSYGNFTFVPATETHGAADGVVGWLDLGYDHPDPETLGGDATSAAYEDLVARALRAADPSVDFASFDTDTDGTVTKEELHVAVVVAGGSDSTGDLDATVWPHQYELAVPEVLDDVALGDGYTMVGERRDGIRSTIGVIVHELGHDIDWPDLYDTDGGSSGVGRWSVMGFGSRATIPGGLPGDTPPHPDAFLKYLQGWIAPVPTSTETGLQLDAATTSTATVARLRHNPHGVDWSFVDHSGTGEYFLVENRQLTGYDAGLPGCGLLVWHIDESRTSTNLANADKTRRLVDLVEADGTQELDANPGTAYHEGEVTDPYAAFPGTAWGEGTLPDSDLYWDDPSGLSMSAVSACGESMTADFAFTPTLSNDAFGSATEVSYVAYTTYIDTRTASVEPADAEPDPSCTGASGEVGNTVWYRYAPPEDDQLHAAVSSGAPRVDTVVAVWRSTGPGIADLVEVACSDDVGADNASSYTQLFEVDAGETYYLQVGGYDGESGELAFELTPADPPIAYITPPATAVSRVRIDFSEPVQGVAAGNVRIVRSGSSTPLPAGAPRCRDVGGVVIACSSGQVRSAEVKPLDPLMPGRFYRVQVAPTGSAPIQDADAMVVAPTPYPFRAQTYLEERDVPVSRSSGWQSIDLVHASGGKYLRHASAGANVSLKFHGSGADVQFVTGRSSGRVSIKLDGVTVATRSLYSATPGLVAIATPPVPAGVHTLKVVVLGTKVSASTGTRVGVDRIMVG